MSNEIKEPQLSTTDSAASLAASPGAMLREARTQARMSLEDLAAATKLARQTLDALERDDFNALQEAVYVRGYYRKCAKILGLSEARLSELYQSRVSPKRPDPPTKVRLASGTEVGEANPLPIPMAVGSAVAAVIIGILLWNLFKSPEPPPTIDAGQPVQVEAPVVTSSALPVDPAAADAQVPATTKGTEAVPADAGNPVPATGPAPTTAAPMAIPATSPAVAAPAGPAAPPSAASKPAAGTSTAPAPVAAPISSAAPAVPSKNLTMTFTGTSWARVEDASGKTLLNGLMREGENQSLRGQPPFSVFLGNGPGVKVEFSGQSVDFSKHVTDNLTARFSVPEGR